MRNLTIFLIVIILGGCKKESCEDGLKNQDEVKIDCGGTCSACSIEYPETGAYGVNILNGAEILYLMEGDYSMRAIIPIGSSLKIELKAINGEGWFYSEPQNWTVSSYSNNRQTFTNLNSEISDIEMYFPKTYFADTTMVDSILIKYFENGNDESMQKLIIIE